MKHIAIAVVALVMAAAMLTGCGCMNSDATYPTILPTTPKPTQQATAPSSAPSTAATTAPTAMPSMPSSAPTDTTTPTAGADGVVPETTTAANGARGRSHTPGTGR